MFICNSLAIYTLHIHTRYQGNAPHFSPRQRLGRRQKERGMAGGQERQEGEDYTAYNEPQRYMQDGKTSGSFK